MSEEDFDTKIRRATQIRNLGIVMLASLVGVIVGFLLGYSSGYAEGRYEGIDAD